MLLLEKNLLIDEDPAQPKINKCIKKQILKKKKSRSENCRKVAEKSFQSLILDHEAFCTAQLRVTDSALCSSSSALHSSVVLSLCLWIVAVQSFTCVQLFVTPWIAAQQTSLSFTVSQSLLKLMSIELVMPSNHLILCHLLLLPSSIFSASGSFPKSQLFVLSCHNRCFYKSE